MIKKFAYLLIIFFFITSCGFTPIYSNKKINNISIEQLNFTGDRTLNNYLKSNLSRYKNRDSSRKIFLEVTTDYQKNILSKDSSGKINKYELVAEVIFTINSNNQKLVFLQRKIMENMNNKSDERSYEISTKQTFANIIANELIDQLLEIE
jgi:outer membrane lipopolysaccharide assembly protein LptE/RlpB